MDKMKPYALLHFILIMLSIAGVFSKFSSTQTFLSIGFILFYCGSLIILFMYAILWQQILKYIPLTVAYVNKGMCLIWGMVFGKIIFNETITSQMIIGSIIVFIGILMVVSDER